MFGLDPQRLHEVAADHLDRVVVPLLADATAKAETEALARVLRRAPFGPEIDDVAGGRAQSSATAGALSDTSEALAGCMERVTQALAPAQPVSSAPSEEAMTSHLRARLGDAGVRAADVVPITGGFSKQTMLFDVVDASGQVEPFVLRRDLPDSPVETSVRDEFPALCDLHAAGVPVPEPRWLDDGSEHVPGPFLVSRRVAGRAIGDPAAGASADLGFDPTDLLATTLAQVHAVPPSAMTRSRLCDTTWDSDALQAQLDYWQRRYRDHASGPLPVLEAAFFWLRQNAELGLQPPVVVHGDYGFYNMLVEDGLVNAIVDWELVHIGSAAWDLAYVRDHVSKLGTYDRFLEAYEAAGGAVPPPEAIDYFQIFTFIRTITMCVVVLASFSRGQMSRIPLVDVCQMIYPLHLSALANELARVSQDIPAAARGADR